MMNRSIENLHESFLIFENEKRGLVIAFHCEMAKEINTFADKSANTLVVSANTS